MNIEERGQVAILKGQGKGVRKIVRGREEIRPPFLAG